MKDKIQELITQHKLSKQECFEQLQELSKLSHTKITKIEKEMLKASIFFLEQELSLRKSVISDLESVLSV
jgi:hypothetical protein